MLVVALFITKKQPLLWFPLKNKFLNVLVVGNEVMFLLLSKNMKK
jgi:hypothetical protein